MKLQCSCGAKYEFELTPAMSNRPVKFVCPACGVDASEFVNSLVGKELGQSSTPSGPPILIPVEAPTPSTPPPSLRPVTLSRSTPIPVVEPGAEESEKTVSCPRH